MGRQGSASLLLRGFGLENCHVMVQGTMPARITLIAPRRTSQSWWRETEAPPANGIFPGRFSPFVSWLSASFLITALGALVLMASETPKFDRFRVPEQALSVMVGRTMDAQEGLNRAPKWEQQFQVWLSGDGAIERDHAIEWYRELAAHSEDPVVPLQLAILQAESGQVSQALLTAYEWKDRDDPFPQFAEVIRAAYSEEGQIDLERIDEMQAGVAGLMGEGWFYDRLAMRLAQRLGDRTAADAIQAQSSARADRLHTYSRRLTVVELGAILLGTGFLVILWRRRAVGVNPVRLHEPGIPPPWPGRIGTAVLLRGGAIGAIIMAICLLYLPQENASLRALAIPMTNVPLLVLAYYHLFRPAGMTFDEGFGLSLPWTHLGRLLGAVLAVVAGGLWGEWVIDRLAEQWGAGSHWTEWFDEDLVWGSGSLVMVSLLEYVVFAPFFEELAFRGLLFAILRRKFRFFPAAFISAGIFGLAHGYGVVGLVSVCWSGILWAWIYEKTGSLAPGILAHALNNLLVCLTVMALLRW